MSLNNKQIESIEKFVKKHYVEWYDVQVELIDHLVNDVEKILSEYPKLSFQEALERSFRKFGPMGFMEIVEKTSNEIQKKYFHNIFKTFKKMLFSHRIILLLSSIFIFYRFILWLPDKKWGILTTYILIPLVPLYFLIKYSIGINKKKKRKVKIYLVEQSILQSITLLYSLFVLQFSFQTYRNFMINLIDSKVPNHYYLIYSLLFFTFLWTYHYAFVEVPEKMIQYTKNQYEKLKAIA